MRFLGVLNSEGGTLRTIDLDDFSRRIEETLGAQGHQVEIEVADGKRIASALLNAASRPDIDVVLAGGGDGTVSTAAAALMGKDKSLAILPAGTMNLFARSLGIPMTLEGAVAAFATGKVHEVDVATANGMPFVHQFSVGMHAKMVHLRSKMQYASRWGKLRASAKAAFSTVMNPPLMRVQLEFGETDLLTRTTGIGVTNNLFGEGTLPYAGNPAGGSLGIYVTVARHRSEILRFAAKLARGRWRDNDQVEIHEAKEVTLRILSWRYRHRCVVDGELQGLDRETVFRIHPRALKVLIPKDAKWATP